jgi:hypothetical protein
MTPPFHGGNTGSNPVPVTIFSHQNSIRTYGRFAEIYANFLDFKCRSLTVREGVNRSLIITPLLTRGLLHVTPNRLLAGRL